MCSYAALWRGVAMHPDILTLLDSFEVLRFIFLLYLYRQSNQCINKKSALSESKSSVGMMKGKKISSVLPLPSQGEFLNILTPYEQRTCLGRHARYCKLAEEELTATKLLEESILSFLKTCTKEDKKKREKIEEYAEERLPSVMELTIESNASDDGDVDDNDHNDDEDFDVLQNGKVLTTMYINEPHILRVSIYRKYLLQYQYFYNIQSITEMMKLLIMPFWSNEIIRENKLSSSLSASSIIPIIPKELPRHQIEPGRRSYQGVEDFNSVLAMVYRKLPDSILIFHDSKILHKPDMGRTFVITPFSLIGTLTMSQDEMNKIDSIPCALWNHVKTDSSQSDCSTNKQQRKKRKLNPFSSAELHASGMGVLVFNDDSNKIVLKSDSYYIDQVIGDEPRLSHDMIWNYLWTLMK